MVSFPLAVALSLISSTFAAARGTPAAGEVNLYSHRHYSADQQLYNLFEQQTGIRVNIIQGTADELIERLRREGAQSPADLLMTVDAGRLERASQLGLLQPTRSAELARSVPPHLQDPEGHWFGLTKRARVVVYDPDRVDAGELSTYADLTAPAWRNRVLVRSSSNVYNQSLLASMIANEGAAAAEAWAAGVVANMARTPRGNGRDQMKAIAAGEGDLAIVNTYYLGLMLNSADAVERGVGASVRVFFPDQDGHGTHINVSGAGVTMSAKNVANAVELLEFLASSESQELFATANYEYPVNPAVAPSELLASWGDFKSDELALARLGELNADAVRIFDRVGWR